MPTNADAPGNAPPAPGSAAAATPKRPKAARSAKETAPADPSAAAEPVEIGSYRHETRRVNNPEVGMVDAESDPEQPKTRWAYDPHLDPDLRFDPGRAEVERLIDDALGAGDDPQVLRDALTELRRRAEPYLTWTGKAERTTFEVDTVSLHVHERIDPVTIINALRGPAVTAKGRQLGLFAPPFEHAPLREAVDFYKHERGWANRLVAGDSLLVMNSLLQKESMAGRVQMIYIDPPYGISYGSNFQPFTHRRNVQDGRDDDLTREPETLKAFRDTWELGLHSYLTYLRDRLLLARELLHETGSVFVQISDENVHVVRNLLDEVFGRDRFVVTIPVKKKGSQKSSLIDPVNDYVLWYGKSPRASGNIKFRPLFEARELDGDAAAQFRHVRLPDGREAPIDAVPGEPTAPLVDYRNNLKGLLRDRPGARPARANPLTNGGVRPNQVQPWRHEGRRFEPGPNNCWSTTSRDPKQADGPCGMLRLARAGRLLPQAGQLRYRSFLDDFGYTALSNWWDGMGGASNPVYVVQTNERIVERCLLMTTDPGDLVLDPTCGSGTTAVAAERWGRRWITCDTSRVAIALAKQRVMTAGFDYYTLRRPEEGVKGGFDYKTVPHVILSDIAHSADVDKVYETEHPAVAAALEALNAALRAAPPAPYEVRRGGRAGRRINFALPAGQTETLPSGESAPAGALLEWEVPHDAPGGWPRAAVDALTAFHAARGALQREMDAVIARKAKQEVLYDQPAKDATKRRVAGPFTVEAVPCPTVLSLDDALPPSADAAIARSGASSWLHRRRDGLLRSGVRAKGGNRLMFADLETLPGMPDIRALHLTGSLVETGERVVVSFGPEHAALSPNQVERAFEEAHNLFPRPKVIVFAAFQFDPEAAKDIDAKKGIVGLKVQMNADLLTDDLKKARSGTDVYWLMGQPDVELRRLENGHYQVEVHGFDYFDTKSGELVSGGKGNIAMWLLDPDYDGRALFPRQVFFPQAGSDDGWRRLAKNMRADLDDERVEQFHGTVSQPFEAGEHARVAVKLLDDRGIESLRVLPLEG